MVAAMKIPMAVGHWLPLPNGLLEKRDFSINGAETLSIRLFRIVGETVSGAEGNTASWPKRKIQREYP